MSSHGSVITHLISQVRIGMDLTKVCIKNLSVVISLSTIVLLFISHECLSLEQKNIKDFIGYKRRRINHLFIIVLEYNIMRP